MASLFGVVLSPPGTAGSNLSGGTLSIPTTPLTGSRRSRTGSPRISSRSSDASSAYGDTSSSVLITINDVDELFSSAEKSANNNNENRNGTEDYDQQLELEEQLEKPYKINNLAKITNNMLTMSPRTIIDQFTSLHSSSSSSDGDDEHESEDDENPSARQTEDGDEDNEIMHNNTILEDDMDFQVMRQKLHRRRRMQHRKMLQQQQQSQPASTSREIDFQLLCEPSEHSADFNTSCTSNDDGNDSHTENHQHLRVRFNSDCDEDATHAIRQQRKQLLEALLSPRDTLTLPLVDSARARPPTHTPHSASNNSRRRKYCLQGSTTTPSNTRHVPTTTTTTTQGLRTPHTPPNPRAENQHHRRFITAQEPAPLPLAFITETETNNISPPDHTEHEENGRVPEVEEEEEERRSTSRSADSEQSAVQPGPQKQEDLPSREQLQYLQSQQSKMSFADQINELTKMTENIRVTYHKSAHNVSKRRDQAKHNRKGPAKGFLPPLSSRRSSITTARNRVFDEDEDIFGISGDSDNSNQDDFEIDKESPMARQVRAKRIINVLLDAYSLDNYPGNPNKKKKRRKKGGTVKAKSQELLYRIEALKKSPRDREIFAEIVEQIKEERRAKAAERGTANSAGATTENIIDRNKAAISRLSPETKQKLLTQQFEEKWKKMRMAQEKHNRLVEERRLTRQLTVDQTEAKIRHIQEIKSKEQAKYYREEWAPRQWQAIIELFLRVHYWESCLVHTRSENLTRQITQNEASKRLAPVFADHMKQIRETRETIINSHCNNNAAGGRRGSLASYYDPLGQLPIPPELSVVHNKYIYLFRWKMRRKPLASGLIRRFLRDIVKAKQIVNYVKTFRRRVILIQRAWRKYVMCSKARKELLTLMWIELENSLGEGNNNNNNSRRHSSLCPNTTFSKPTTPRAPATPMSSHRRHHRRFNQPNNNYNNNNAANANAIIITTPRPPPGSASRNTTRRRQSISGNTSDGKSASSTRGRKRRAMSTSSSSYYDGSDENDSSDNNTKNNSHKNRVLSADRKYIPAEVRDVAITGFIKKKRSEFVQRLNVWYYEMHEYEEKRKKILKDASNSSTIITRGQSGVSLMMTSPAARQLLNLQPPPRPFLCILSDRRGIVRLIEETRRKVQSGIGAHFWR